MFIHVERRRKRPQPWVTFCFIVVCVAVFLWLAIAPEAAGQFKRQWGTVPSWLLDPNVPILQQFAELRWLRLFTALFIHSGWLHLVGDLLFLMIFGVPTERALGPWRFLFLLLVGGVLANLAEAVILANANAPIVGSSGAVSAIIGAYLGLFPRARLGLVLPLGMFLEFVRVPAPLLIGFWAMLQVAFTFVGPAFGAAVAWWTHIVGFAIGILFALISRGRRLRDAFETSHSLALQALLSKQRQKCDNLRHARQKTIQSYLPEPRQDTRAVCASGWIKCIVGLHRSRRNRVRSEQ